MRKKTLHKKKIATAILVLLSAYSITSYGADRKGTVSISFENDLFGPGEDDNYTHGSQISYVSDTYMPHWAQRAAEKLSYDTNYTDIRYVTTIGQQIYAPADISRSELIEDDRPYAGWLYFSAGLLADSNEGKYRTLDKSEIIVGLVGPDSGAEAAQKTAHKLVGVQRPEGWDNQLHNEFTLDIQFQRQWMIPILDNRIDVVPQINTILGSSNRSVGTGATFRIGKGVNADYGPPLLRPSATGSNYFNNHQDFYWYFFTGVFGRYVEHNIFLDGNTDGNSHSVDKNEWIGDVQLGLVAGAGDWRVTFTNIIRSHEFEKQTEGDAFGSIGVSYRF
ncbi:lipid A deacylase LpxR family protein [Sessilibacter sp. MAH1]